MINVFRMNFIHNLLVTTLACNGLPLVVHVHYFSLCIADPNDLRNGVGQHAELLFTFLQLLSSFLLSCNILVDCYTPDILSILILDHGQRCVNEYSSAT